MKPRLGKVALMPAWLFARSAARAVVLMSLQRNGRASGAGQKDHLFGRCY
jgi:hypothetical protein